MGTGDAIKKNKNTFICTFALSIRYFNAFFIVFEASLAPTLSRFQHVASNLDFISTKKEKITLVYQARFVLLHKDSQAAAPSVTTGADLLSLPSSILLYHILLT